jgi:two-component system cell cycle sensor histidine kinase/response regulator CckA
LWSFAIYNSYQEYRERVLRRVLCIYATLPGDRVCAFSRGFMKAQEKSIEHVIEDLKESNMLGQLLLDNADEALFFYSMDEKLIYVSHAFEKITGYTIQELYEKNFIPYVYPDDQEWTTRLWQGLFKGEFFEDIEYRIVKKDGDIRWCSSSWKVVLDDFGRQIGIQGKQQDITKRKQLEEALQESEKRLSDVQRVGKIGCFTFDLTTGLWSGTDMLYPILGIEEKREYSVDDWVEIIHPDHRDSLATYQKSILEQKIPFDKDYLIVRQSDGETRWVHSFGELQFDDSGNVIAMIGTTRDITERKEQEEQLRRSQKMEALGKLTGGISHDYNNLLGIIQGYSGQLLEHLAHESKLTKYVLDIQRAAERGSRLTKKLLAFSRQKTPDATVLNINTLLRDEKDMLEKTLTARIKLTFDLADDLWPVELDSSDLEDAIVNISINAMHAMESGGELTFNTRNEQLYKTEAQRLHLEPGDYVLLSIADTGCGMDETTKENIFDPFFTTKGERGTGLGLSQVYGFVERSGGSIKTYSEPGHGSRFVLYFPRSHKSDTDIQSMPSLETQNLRGNETILVVDDEQSMVELAYDILTAQGYRVLTANDGEQALSLIEKEAVDLVVTDVIMPRIDGYQLATTIQKNYPQIKIQIVSGFADSRYGNRVDPILHKNILRKPCTSNKLLTRVRSLLDETRSKARTEINLTGRTILIMDDEEDTQELFKLNLNRLGCKAILASTGEEAITLYQQALDNANPIDVVILDLSIPGGTGGKEVAKKLRALDPKAKLIVASGYSEGPEMTEYQSHGFDGALEKNFNRENIKQVLEQVLSPG